MSRLLHCIAAPFRLQGRVGRAPYAAGVLVVLAMQMAVTLAVLWSAKLPTTIDAELILLPMRAIPHRGEHPPANLFHLRIADTGVLYFLFYLVTLWRLAALSFRRAIDAGTSGWVAAATIVPVLQVPAVLALAVCPPRAAPAVAPVASPPAPIPWLTTTQGLLAGMGLTVFAVVVSALGLGRYGYGLFFVSPFVVGFVTAWLGNREQDVGAGRTAALVTGAVALGGLALLAMALEGAACIILAAPLALLAAYFGSACGRAFVLAGRRSKSPVLMSVGFLPLVFASETAFPPRAMIETEQSVVVDAPPSAVWAAMIAPADIRPPPLLFRLSLAYPVRGEIDGEGVGATRRGVFSTGVALEEITAWSPGRTLAFVVKRDPPVMRELSPYVHVHAPHVVGYFRTLETRFDLAPLPGGRTRLVEHTTHVLNLDPVLYWTPLARWAVDQNNIRVLAHIRTLAESRESAAHP